MREDDEGAAGTGRKFRGVLVLSRGEGEEDGIREWARARGVVVMGEWGELDLEAIQVALRRTAMRPAESVLRCGPLRLEPAAHDVTVDGAPLGLRRTERDVLVYLMRNAHRFVTSRELQEQVLRAHGDGGAARNQVYELRRKLRAMGHAQAILTRPQLGYRLRWP
jgi:DNA-binding response OmpR family regulator